MAVQLDKIRNVAYWKPSHRQEDFLRIPPTVFEALYGGAAGGGKSEVLLMLPIVKGYFKNPRFKGIVFRRTFPQLEESLIPRAFELGFEKYLGGKYNETKHLWTFESGATIRFSYLDRDEDARDHDTAEYHYAGFDELTHFTEFMYTYITSRVRTSDNTLPAIVRAASNPGNIGHGWVRKRFVEPSIAGDVVLKDALSNTTRIFIPAKLTDNPHITENDPNYINRLQLLPERERKAKIEGDWFSFEGQVFGEFRNIKRPNEPAHALHVIDPFDIPDFWPKVLAIDWGFAATLWAGFAALSPDNRIFIFDEYVCQYKYIREWGAEIAQKVQKIQNLQVSELDPSAWQKRGDEQTIAEQASQATNLIFHKADNDRIGGKLLIHDLLRWKQRPPKYVPREGYQSEKYDAILRLYGMDAANEYRKMFTPEEPETNLPRLQIFKNCKVLIDTIPLCVYDERNTEDVAEFKGDDPYDGLRYLLKACERYQNECKREYDRLGRITSIDDRLARTGDYTSYYRAHEKLEADERRAPLSFSRYRGRHQTTLIKRG